MYVNQDEKWIVFCWVVSHHGQQWKRVYEHWKWKSYLQLNVYIQNDDRDWTANWNLYTYLYDRNTWLN